MRGEKQAEGLPRGQAGERGKLVLASLRIVPTEVAAVES